MLMNKIKGEVLENNHNIVATFHIDCCESNCGKCSFPWITGWKIDVKKQVWIPLVRFSDPLLEALLKKEVLVIQLEESGVPYINAEMLLNNSSISTEEEKKMVTIIIAKALKEFEDYEKEALDNVKPKSRKKKSVIN